MAFFPYPRILIYFTIFNGLFHLGDTILDVTSPQWMGIFGVSSFLFLQRMSISASLGDPVPRTPTAAIARNSKAGRELGGLMAVAPKDEWPRWLWNQASPDS